MVRAQRKRRNRPARPTDQIVIDGYPRSANTFATRALMSANPGVAASHHMHAPANILLAARYKLPTIVVVRAPVDAVLSEVISHSRLSLRRGLLEWNSFYATALPVLDQIVVGEFSVVTSDYAIVIEAVNRRFGTHFVPYHNSAEADEAVFASIEAGARARGKSGTLLEQQVPRPSTERADRKAALRAELERAELQPLVEQAQSLYAQFAAAAPRTR
jgi:hypothetical protein